VANVSCGLEVADPVPQQDADFVALLVGRDEVSLDIPVESAARPTSSGIGGGIGLGRLERRRCPLLRKTAQASWRSGWPR